MSNTPQIPTHWTICPDCKGRGKTRQRLRKKAKLQYQKELIEFEKSEEKGIAPTRPRGHLIACSNCLSSGLIKTTTAPKPDSTNYPKIAIIGGGIGGMALAVACLHRNIPFTLYERDLSFNDRSQGYGLTLQQASKAIKGFGIFNLQEGVISNRHLVHQTDGTVIGEWGMRKWLASDKGKKTKNTNIHIARQSLRKALLDQLHDLSTIKWGHQLKSYETNSKGPVTLHFDVNGKALKTTADLVVGADGIRSKVRPLLVGENNTPLRYLGCIVILGICPLDHIQTDTRDLLDNATVFQTANGHDRMYMMPFNSKSIMWQFSFPISEIKAKQLSKQGAKALKEEVLNRAQWHNPIPQILQATATSEISGYPVYDRELLTPDLLKRNSQITLIGDAAHPMSPFKGQGANQALLDALSLAKEIYHGCNPLSTPHWREAGLQLKVLSTYENEMLKRSAVKVEDSAKAVEVLHSEIVLQKKNKPRGS